MVWGGVFTTLVFVVALSFASCANSADSEGSPQENQGSQYSINYSLGTPPAENFSFEKLGLNFSEKKDSEGIYLEFDIPKGISQYRVYIEGLGAVAESIYELNEDRTKGCFFYPFVDAGKAYTIRIIFLREEDEDKDGFSRGHVGDDGMIGWFQTEVTAGAKSKGEVRLTSKGKIYVNKNGDFKFTERPTFQNEHLLGNDWVVNMGLVEGVSWEHGAERKTKWNAAEIPQADITTLYNLYDNKYAIWGNPLVIDFICVRPVKYYKHNDGKTYNYQWESFVQDIFYPQKIITFEDIDITNPSQVGKIQGTWKSSESWEGELFLDEHYVSVKTKITTILIVQGENLEYTESHRLTRKNGQYTEEEKNSWNYNWTSEDELSKTTQTISDDGTTAIYKGWGKTTLSDYFEQDIKVTDAYGERCSGNRRLKLFEDSDLGRLQEVISYTDSKGVLHEVTSVYNRQ